jgi:hypothetical protein
MKTTTTTSNTSKQMKPLSTFSPVSLRYIAALRGNRPKPVGKEFTYAQAACADPENLICLAASNPEGRFYGLVADEAARRGAETAAVQRGVFNTVFLVGKPSEILARIANGASLPPMLDFLCCDESTGPLDAAERTALFDLAEKRLIPGGQFVTSYQAYANRDGALRFLVSELAPEMNADQKQEFLTELKRLGTTFLSAHPDVAAKLNDAIAKGAPESFYAAYPAPSSSGAFDTLLAMGSRGLAYAGDANLLSNYVELAVPTEAQALVVSCRDHFLFEPIKDLALDRTLRTDIWVKTPVTGGNTAELFGGFAYGITMAREDVPSVFAARGKAIDLSSPLYVKLIDLMTLLPIGIGDFLNHPSGAGESAAKVVEALQILVACGIATPMRGQRTPMHNENVAQPRFVGSFNRYLDKTALSGADVCLASQVMGCGITVSGREALVMQALNRAGLNDSVSALMPELRRLATSGGVSPVKGDPTAEGAQALVRNVVSKSLPQWFAYAILEAA